MTRSIRAYRAAAQCDEAADACETAAPHAPASAGAAEMAKLYRRNAAEWRRIAREEGARERAARRSCYCGRSITDRDATACAEHDGPHAVLTAV